MQKRKAGKVRAFTLIELLIVMVIIAILASLTLGSARYMQEKAGRSRAAGEIAALETALSSYQIDNGIYPGQGTAAFPDPRSAFDPTDDTYKSAARLLFKSLAGRDTWKNTTSEKVYFDFKQNQVDITTDGQNFVKDPFKNAYGYSISSDAATSYNTNFPDLWSTTGKTTSADTGKWVTNWGQK